MSDWLVELELALDRADAPVPFFFRADCVGWADERLFPLLDVFEAHAVPLDLAVIPCALQDATAEALRERLERSAGRLRAHQHGYAHRDHERGSPRAEFGPARSLAQQRADLVRGAELLARRLAPFVDPIFTPPWGRCGPETAGLVVALGMRVLSCDVAAARLGDPRLVELPVTVEWLARVQLRGAFAGSVRAGGAVGVRLEHACIDEAERSALAALLALLVSHPRARCGSMRALARASLA
jgi:hypothetical protein